MDPIDERLPDLKKRHYVRRAAARNFWFDFAAGPMRRYCEQYGESFCLVIHGTAASYVIPFIEVRDLFVRERLDAQGRWMGLVTREHIMRMSYDNGERDVRSFILPRGAPDADLKRLLNEEGQSTNES